MGAVAKAVLERRQDQGALDLGHGATDQIARDLLCGHLARGGELASERADDQEAHDMSRLLSLWLASG